MSFTNEEYNTAFEKGIANPNTENLSRIGSICAVGYGKERPDQRTALAWYILAAQAGALPVREIGAGVRSEPEMTSREIKFSQHLAGKLCRQYFRKKSLAKAA